VEFRDVSKAYPIYSSPIARLKELLVLNRLSFHADFWALRDVSFQIRKGETFCVIGENGSGKSTLLQLVAGILHPTKGTVQVNGRVSALLELGSGFNPEFTGRENVYLNAAILGFSRKEMDRKLPEIEQFAEIGSFIDQPVKTYSSGMNVRLAFAVAIHVEPEILIVDEALAVGDIYFRQRCMRKVHELREQGVTILFVSHDVGDVKAIGDRALWLEKGQAKALGDPELVVNQYLAAMTEKDAVYLHAKQSRRPVRLQGPMRAPEVVTTIPNIDHRFGDARAEVIGIAVLDSHGQSVHILEPNTAVVVRISVKAHQPLAEPIIGFIMRNHMGLDFAGTNTAREGVEVPAMGEDDIFTVDFHLHVPHLYPSHFSFSPAIADGTLHSYTTCDWIDNALTLQMTATGQPVYGHIHLPCRVEINHALEPQLG
jgi:ABC-type polysaccharide/polyol phosphate transport system ATPase subunit